MPDPTGPSDRSAAGRGGTSQWPHDVATCLRHHKELFLVAGAALVLVPLVQLLVDPHGNLLLPIADLAIVLGLIAFILITESRHEARLEATAQAVEAKELRFRQMAEEGPDISFRYRIDPPVFEYVSPSWERVTGMPAATALADREATLRLIEPADLPRLGAVMRNGTEPGHPEIIRVRRTDGSSRYAEFQSTLLRDASGVATHTVGTARDVTERVIAEQARAEMDARFRLLAEQSQDIVFEWRLGETPGFGYLSPAFERVTGHSVEDARSGRVPAMDLVRNEDVAQLADALAHGTPQGSPIRFRVRRIDGEERTIELAATSVPATEGAPGRTIGAARDITERVRTEERLRQSETRFREMADRSRDIIFRYQLRNLSSRMRHGFSVSSLWPAPSVG